MTAIDNITFVTIDTIDTTFGEFIYFIFVVSKDFAHVVGIDANGSDIVFLKNIDYFVVKQYNQELCISSITRCFTKRLQSRPLK